MPDSNAAESIRARGIAQRTWDFYLTVAAVVLLASLGVQSFIGTGYTWWAERSFTGWEQGAGYTSYVQRMNAFAAPQIVALVVVMGLCVPKRLFTRRSLLAVSLAMVAVGVLAWAVSGSLSAGLAAYLLLASLIQVAVLVLTLAGTRSPSYLTEGRLTKVGSGLLHLGFIVVCFVVAVLQDSRFMQPVFYLGAIAMVGGTALAFWANRVAFGHRRRPLTEEEQRAFEGADAEPVSEEATADEASEPSELPDHGGDER